MIMKQNSESLNKVNPSSLQFSESAISHFKSQLISQSEISYIRIGVRKAGCSGYEYFFEYAEVQDEDDTQDEYNQSDRKASFDGTWASRGFVSCA